MSRAKKQTTTPDLDPAAAQYQKLLERQRKRAARVLLKRRRQKSHQ
jgi:hypothetical protein